MISISKNLFIDKLDDIVNKYNNTYHRTIKMKPVYVFIMSRMLFRVNPHSIFACMSRNAFLEAGIKSEV